jgi:hypothetical protein
MDKLETFSNGGEPFTLDDLQFLQNGLRNGIIGLGKGFKSSGTLAIILDGLTSVVVGPNTVWTDGIVMRNGEIFYITGGSVLTSAPNTYFNFDQTNDPNGTDTFENLTVIDTYKIRAGYVTGLSTGDTINIDDTQNLSDVLARMVTSSGYLQSFIDPNAWILVDATTTPVLNSNWSSPYPLKYRLLKTKEVALKGMVLNASTANANHLIFTLPTGFRPAQNCSFSVYGLAGATVISHTVSVLTNGEVNSGPFTGTSLEVSLDSIRFFID